MLESFPTKSTSTKPDGTLRNTERCRYNGPAAKLMQQSSHNMRSGSARNPEVTKVYSSFESSRQIKSPTSSRENFTDSFSETRNSQVYEHKTVFATFCEEFQKRYNHSASTECCECKHVAARKQPAPVLPVRKRSQAKMTSCSPQLSISYQNKESKHALRATVPKTWRTRSQTSGYAPRAKQCTPASASRTLRFHTSTVRIEVKPLLQCKVKPQHHCRYQYR